MSTRYRSPYTARVMLRPSTSLRTATLKQMHKVVKREIYSICSRKYGDSVLRLSTLRAITNFSWGPFLHELKLQTPTLNSFIRAALSKRGYKVRHYNVGMSASVLLKCRSKHLQCSSGSGSDFSCDVCWTQLQAGEVTWSCIDKCLYTTVFAMQVVIVSSLSVHRFFDA